MLKKASEYSINYINNNLELKNKIQYGIDNNLVFKFGDEEIEKIKSLSYVVIYDDVIKLFEDGYNLGNCSVFAKLLSYAYPNSKIGIGYFEPSYDGKNGHAWMETNEYIYDTTLLLKIEKKYAEILGYVKLKEFDPMLDSIYRSRKNIYEDRKMNKR